MIPEISSLVELSDQQEDEQKARLKARIEKKRVEQEREVLLHEYERNYLLFQTEKRKEVYVLLKWLSGFSFVSVFLLIILDGWSVASFGVDQVTLRFYTSFVGLQILGAAYFVIQKVFMYGEFKTQESSGKINLPLYSLKQENA